VLNMVYASNTIFLQGTDLLEKLTAIQLVKKFITVVFTRAH